MNPIDLTLDAGLLRALDRHTRLTKIQRRWKVGRHTRERWQIIRDAYSLQLPAILRHACDPYFLDWGFTPIEALAWQDIRGLGVRLYPQFPALNYFIDFADPVLQIGVELDGAAYHDINRDEIRDMRLWQQGWRIFRIPGRESLAAPIDPRFDLNPGQMRDSREQARALFEWGSRWSTGFFWALKAAYYAQSRQAELEAVAFHILDLHRLIEFPLDLESRRSA